jgi:hypothetical protein
VSELTDCKATRTSGSVVTVDAPCNFSIGGSLFALTADATATLSGTSTNGTVYFYWNSSGQLIADENTTATLACNASCTTATTGAFPSNGFQVATATFTATAYNVGGVTDKRSALNMKIVECGSGMTCSDSGGITTVARDTLQFPASFSIGAAACNGTTAAILWNTFTTAPAVAACATGTNTQEGVAAFADGATALSMQIGFSLPSDWTAALGLNVKPKWSTGATTGSVVWQAATACVADGEVDDAAFNAASTVTDAAKGTANQMNDAAITSVTVTGCAAGERLHLKITRDPAHASDNLAATANLHEVVVSYWRTI